MIVRDCAIWSCFFGLSYYPVINLEAGWDRVFQDGNFFNGKNSTSCLKSKRECNYIIGRKLFMLLVLLLEHMAVKSHDKQAKLNPISTSKVYYEKDRVAI